MEVSFDQNEHGRGKFSGEFILSCHQCYPTLELQTRAWGTSGPQPQPAVLQTVLYPVLHRTVY